MPSRAHACGPAAVPRCVPMPPAERPLSPHLQIYKPQLTSVLSIAHRATGCVLAAGTLFLTWWLVAAAAGGGWFAAAQRFWGSWLGLLMLFGWTFSLFYHLANGVRHLVWDAGYGFELEDAYVSGWIVVGSSAVLTLLAWIAGLIAWQT
jgi:succinate dehydrogenase / fumarate reductase, cytochrome b subunit